SIIVISLVLTLFFVLFFFQFSRAPRALHSFPTRRSSDLLGAVGTALVAQERRWGLLNNVALPDWLAVVLAIIALDLAIYLQHVIDRKSTRLNSSHSQISYAVFCLKKKKKKNKKQNISHTK